MRLYFDKRECFVLSTALLCLKTHYPNTMGNEAQQVLDKLNLAISIQKNGKGYDPSEIRKCFRMNKRSVSCIIKSLND